jgi:hypothetical protein
MAGQPVSSAIMGRIITENDGVRQRMRQASAAEKVTGDVSRWPALPGKKYDAGSSLCPYPLQGAVTEFYLGSLRLNFQNYAPASLRLRPSPAVQR